MALTVHFEVLNQLGTPMMHSATLANRPAAGIAGRIFFRTDSPFGIFRDTGIAWDQISSAGGNTIYTADDTLTSNRTVSSGGFTLTFTPQTTFFSSLTAAVNASSFSVLGSNTLTYAAGFNSNNIGNVYSANGAINSQIFNGNATFAQANLASAMVNVNKIDFSSGGHTVTMTQASGIRAMTGEQNQIQFEGSHNGTISHVAVSQNLGFFRTAGSTRTLTITNAYSHLINALDDYGAGFAFTNRWGYYQAGINDTNYFAANVLIGSLINTGQKLQITGTSLFTGSVQINTFLGVGSGPNSNGNIQVGQGLAVGYITTATARNSFIVGGSGTTINQNTFTLSSGGYGNVGGNGSVTRYILVASPSSVGAGSVTNIATINGETLKLNDGTSSGINSFYNAGIITVDLTVYESSQSGNSNMYAGIFVFRFKRYLINGVGTFTDISAVTNIYNSADTTLIGTTLQAVQNGNDAINITVTLPGTANTANYRMGGNVTISKVNIN
jgi:hypothetical protein